MHSLVIILVIFWMLSTKILTYCTYNILDSVVTYFMAMMRPLLSKLKTRVLLLLLYLSISTSHAVFLWSESASTVIVVALLDNQRRF